MFAGHYAASFVAKATDRRIPLWMLFVAAQLSDILWAPLVLAGVEKVRVLPQAMAADRLDLYHMPYTHSLVAGFLLAAAAYFSYRWWRRDQGTRAAMLMALTVLSHWVLDALVHKPDMPLVTDAMKVGLHIWRWPILSLVLEAALLFGSMWVFLRGQHSGRTSLLAFGVVLVVMQIGAFFGPPLTSGWMLAVTGFMGLSFCAAFVGWWEWRYVRTI